MEEIDRQRKENFKQYEMKKQAEEDHKLAGLQPEQREQEKHKVEEAKKRHNEHEQLKHPGGREQLEEVWEEGDHVSRGGLWSRFRWTRTASTRAPSSHCTT